MGDHFIGGKKGPEISALPTAHRAFPSFGGDKFFLRAVNAQISFTKDAAGEVIGMILHQGGRDQSAQKVR